jgi:hypothetical protein
MYARHPPLPAQTLTPGPAQTLNLSAQANPLGDGYHLKKRYAAHVAWCRHVDASRRKYHAICDEIISKELTGPGNLAALGRAVGRAQRIPLVRRAWAQIATHALHRLPGSDRWPSGTTAAGGSWRGGSRFAARLGQRFVGGERA